MSGRDSRSAMRGAGCDAESQWRLRRFRALNSGPAAGSQTASGVGTARRAGGAWKSGPPDALVRLAALGEAMPSRRICCEQHSVRWPEADSRTVALRSVAAVGGCLPDHSRFGLRWSGEEPGQLQGHPSPAGGFRPVGLRACQFRVAWIRVARFRAGSCFAHGPRIGRQSACEMAVAGSWAAAEDPAGGDVEAAARAS